MLKLTVASLTGFIGGAVLGSLLCDADGVDPPEVLEASKETENSLELALHSLAKESKVLEEKVARLESEKSVHVKANDALQERVDELESLAVRQASENDDLQQDIIAERTAFNNASDKLARTEREVRRLKSQLAQATMKLETVTKENAAIAEELRLLKSSGAQANQLGICSCFLAPKFDCDFRSVNDIGKHFESGGKPYIRPIGCQRFALNVAGKYDGGDDWLTNWWNAYSGTSIKNAREIARNGFHLSKAVRKAFGKGIYCTPDPETAKVYARNKGAFCNNGTSYLVLVQVRVDPTKCKFAKAAGQGPLKDGEYWTVSDNDAIRPYAICLFEE